MHIPTARGRGLSWLLSGGVPGLLVVLVITFQFLVPAIALNDPPTRFGFQMYSGTGQFTVTATDAAGNSRIIEPEEYVIDPRTELDWTEDLPEYVCAHLDVVTVTVVQGSERRSLQCAN